MTTADNLESVISALAYVVEQLRSVVEDLTPPRRHPILAYDPESGTCFDVREFVSAAGGVWEGADGQLVGGTIILFRGGLTGLVPAARPCNIDAAIRRAYEQEITDNLRSPSLYARKASL